MENPFTFQNLPGQPQSDQKMMENLHAFIYFPDEIVSTKMFADMNLRKFLLSHQIVVLFYWTLGDTHEPLLPKSLLDVNTGD